MKPKGAASVPASAMQDAEEVESVCCPPRGPRSSSEFGGFLEERLRLFTSPVEHDPTEQ